MPAAAMLAGALLLVPVAAFALEVGGYLRAGAIAAPVNDRPPCVGLASPGLRYRLGNECNSQAEATLTVATRSAGATYQATVTPFAYVDPYAPEAGLFDYEQAYVARRSAEGGEDASSVWLGRRRDWEEFYLVDTYFLNMSGEGIGVARLKLGAADWSVSAYRASNFDTVEGYRFHVDMSGWQAGALGKVRVVGSAATAGPGGSTRRAGTGISLELVSEGLAAEGDRNELLVQGAFGAIGLEQGFASQPASRGSWRAIDLYGFQVGRAGGQAIALAQCQDNGTRRVLSTSVGARLAWSLYGHAKLLVEASQVQREPHGEMRQVLAKGTLSLAMSPAADYWSRPEFRVFVTAARYDRAAANDPDNSLSPDRRTARFGGVQVETWF